MCYNNAAKEHTREILAICYYVEDSSIIKLRLELEIDSWIPGCITFVQHNRRIEIRAINRGSSVAV